MQNNTQFIIVGAVTLVIGLCLGTAWSSRTPEYRPTSSGGMMMHQMPDGSMMRTGGSMSDMMDDMSAGLRGKTGDDFDKTFLSEMIVHHQGAVDMASAVLETSKRPELISLAHNIIDAQTKEIQMMKTWQKQWFNQ